MSDDHQPGGTPPPMRKPVFVPPGGGFAASAPPVGEPPVSPPAGADRWPAHLGILAFFAGLAAMVVFYGVFAVIYLAAGGHEKDPELIILATVIQSVVFAGTAVGMARTVGPVSARDFGLVRAPLGPTIGKTLFVAVAYFVLLAAYAALVHLTPDDSPEKLGAGEGMIGMAGFVIVAALIAPLAEEFFFRGMVYRSLANGIGVVAAAIVSGVLFGALHIDSLASERLLQVVPLALLGIFFALLYQWSGTLFAPIAVHATNNALAVIVFANDEHSAFGVALGVFVWLLLMTFCLLGWQLTDRPRKNPPAAPENPLAPDGWS